MAYCRIKANKNNSDIYAYASVYGGFVIHTTWLKGGPKNSKPFNHPLAGKTYELDTLEEFRDKLFWLRDNGLNVPQYVINRVNKDIKEQ